MTGIPGQPPRWPPLQRSAAGPRSGGPRRGPAAPPPWPATAPPGAWPPPPAWPQGGLPPPENHDTRHKSFFFKSLKTVKIKKEKITRKKNQYY
eukprot:8718373-Pyramimonas_sp.AAC.1